MHKRLCLLTLCAGLATTGAPAHADAGAAPAAVSGTAAAVAASGTAAPAAASGEAAPAASSGPPPAPLVQPPPSPPLPPPPPPWKASAELGYIESSGAGITTTSLHAKVHAEYQNGDWAHEANILALSTSSNAPGTATTEQYTVNRKSKRSFTPLDYMFFLVEWDKDIPGPLDYQAFVSTGYGRYLIKDATQQLSAEIGGGIRHDQGNAMAPPGTVPVETRNSGISNFNADYHWDISPTVSFGEKVDVQYGVTSTVAHAMTELKKSVTHDLAFSVNYDYRRITNPDVPALVTRITTLNLIYQIR